MSRSIETLAAQADERTARHIQVVPQPYETNTNEPDGILLEAEAGMVNRTGEIPTEILRGKTMVGAATLYFTAETPVELSDDVPILFVQGFMGPELVYENLRHASTQHGRRAITVGRAGWQRPCAILGKHHRLRPHTVTEQSPWAVVKALGEDEVDVVGHSLGGPIGVGMALRRHDHVRSLTLLGPAGVTDDNLLTLGLRLPAAAAEIKRGLPSMYKSYGLRGALAILDYVYKNPARLVGEAITAANSDIKPGLSQLGELGVKTAIGAFTKDCFFDEADMRKNSESIVDIFEDIEANRAGHIAPQLEYETVAAQIDDIHDRMFRAA